MRTGPPYWGFWFWVFTLRGLLASNSVLEEKWIEGMKFVYLNENKRAGETYGWLYTPVKAENAAVRTTFNCFKKVEVDQEEDLKRLIKTLRCNNKYMPENKKLSITKLHVA